MSSLVFIGTPFQILSFILYFTIILVNRVGRQESISQSISWKIQKFCYNMQGIYIWKDNEEIVKLLSNRWFQEIRLGHKEEIKRLKGGRYHSYTNTLSRDCVRWPVELRDEEGKLYYSLSEHVLFFWFGSYQLGTMSNQFPVPSLCWFSIQLGEADILADLIDSDSDPQILGTVAGTDTLLVICKDSGCWKIGSEFRDEDSPSVSKKPKEALLKHHEAVLAFRGWENYWTDSSI